MNPPATLSRFSPLPFPSFRPCPTWATLLLATALVACSRPPDRTVQGYVEGEMLYLGAPVPGLLQQRPVDRGQAVAAGDLLFVLESAADHAALTETERRLSEAQARVDNLRKGRRPTEIAALEARVAQAQATRDLWTAEFARREQLSREQVISPAELDQIRSQRDAAQAALESAVADLATARLGGREDEVRAAEAEREAAHAAVARARWVIDQKSQRTAVAGRVHDTLYRVGEFVPTGSPVVALLPPENLKIRFFIPEAALSRIGPGHRVRVSRDGTDTAFDAVVRYVATQAEFTPPVIYSREMRSKLVFMVEAQPPPELADQFRPGQPVDVLLEP